MNNDIIPPKRPLPQAEAAPERPVATPVSPEGSLLPPQASARKRPSLLLHITKLVVGLILVVGLALGAYYLDALRPVAQSKTAKTRVLIADGSSPSRIAQTLRQHGLIRNELVFELYARMHGSASLLKAGTYSMSPSESVSDIVSQLSSGHQDTVNLTFFPGATLTDHSSLPSQKKTDVETVLLRAGYSQQEITAAFAKQYPAYDSTVFASKPSSSDLEGYVYGETYNFTSGASVQQILSRTFDELATKINEQNLVERFKNQGLTLYQGITLASIIQREVSGANDQRQVAQIFLLRLSQGKSLGSDVTYQYAAKKLGVAPSPSLDSPYNTRLYPGLPPGPISAPGLSALEAVADPAPGDYLFFLSGDDGNTYFAHTDAEHQANIRDHCKIKCAIN
jgi:UPF0755 protein